MGETELRDVILPLKTDADMNELTGSLKRSVHMVLNNQLESDATQFTNKHQKNCNELQWLRCKLEVVALAGIAEVDRDLRVRAMHANYANDRLKSARKRLSNALDTIEDLDEEALMKAAAEGKTEFAGGMEVAGTEEDEATGAQVAFTYVYPEAVFERDAAAVETMLAQVKQVSGASNSARGVGGDPTPDA